MNPKHLVRWKLGYVQDPKVGLKWLGHDPSKSHSLFSNQRCSKFLLCSIESLPYYEILNLGYRRNSLTLFILCNIVGGFLLPWIVGF